MIKLLFKTLILGLFFTSSYGVILFSESHVGIDFDDLEFEFEIHDVRKQDRKLLTLNSLKNKGNSFKLSNVEGVTSKEDMLKKCEAFKNEFTDHKMTNGDSFCEIVGSTKSGRKSLRLVMNQEKKKAYILEGSSKEKKSLKSEFDTLVSDLQTF